MTSGLGMRIAELTGSRTPFVRATVVRAQGPSSARAGDLAIVLADGSMEGFVGGHCAADSVRAAALSVLDRRESVLLRVIPDGEAGFPEAAGASVVVNPCLSGGALEIFLEPLLPSPIVHVAGTSPIARAIAELAPVVGFAVVDGTGPGADSGADLSGAAAAVVCTQDGAEAVAVRAALDAGVGYVGVVCSATRGEILLDELGLTDEERRRVRPHAGIDIGAKTAPEIGLSIVAELVRVVRRDGLDLRLAGETEPRPEPAVDPACGMTVVVGPGTPTATVDGVRHWFCNPGCRDRFAGGSA
ncbi:MAG: XdhC family protein [Nocardioides sp.]